MELIKVLIPHLELFWAVQIHHFRTIRYEMVCSRHSFFACHTQGRHSRIMAVTGTGITIRKLSKFRDILHSQLLHLRQSAASNDALTNSFQLMSTYEHITSQNFTALGGLKSRNIRVSAKIGSECLGYPARTRQWQQSVFDQCIEGRAWRTRCQSVDDSEPTASGGGAARRWLLARCQCGAAVASCPMRRGRVASRPGRCRARRWRLARCGAAAGFLPNAARRWLRRLSSVVECIAHG